MDNPSITDGSTEQSATNDAGSSYTWLDWVKRLYILLLAGAAVAFSIIVVFSCEFFSYRSLDGQTWDGLMPPFDTLVEASVGLFSYSTSIDDDRIELSQLMAESSCLEYDDPWDVGQNDYWTIAQYCAMAAPAAGILALSQLLLEMVLCRLRCSFLLVAFLFLTASALQGCTFMIFADREFCFNAASQNQCRLNSGAWFSMASAVAYLIVAILCTSIDPFTGHATRYFCCVMTKDWRRGTKEEKDIESDSNDEEKVNAETSDSSGDGHNWRDVVQNSDSDDADEDDFAQSNMAAAESMQWKPTEDSADDEDITQASSMLHNEGTNNDMALNSGSVDDSLHINSTESDVQLNKNDNFQKEKAITKYNHTFPRKPDFLDMCCAGDPLEVEKHLEYPVKLDRSKKSTKL